MEFRVLQYFLAVAREQSLSGAAEFLHLSQPTLSRQLKELEEELKRLLYQWMIRSKSVKTILQAVGVCGVSGKNCGLMIAKLAETFRYKISGEY